jgi:hypothetical protein
MPGTLRLANQPVLEALGSHPKTAGCPFERSRQRYKASLLDEAREPQPPGQAEQVLRDGKLSIWTNVARL